MKTLFFKASLDFQGFPCSTPYPDRSPISGAVASCLSREVRHFNSWQPTGAPTMPTWRTQHVTTPNVFFLRPWKPWGTSFTTILSFLEWQIFRGYVTFPASIKMFVSTFSLLLIFPFLISTVCNLEASLLPMSPVMDLQHCDNNIEIPRISNKKTRGKQWVSVAMLVFWGDKWFIIRPGKRKHKYTHNTQPSGLVVIRMAGF